MTITPLTPRVGHHSNVTSFADARQLVADVESLGGKAPKTLHNLLDAHAALTAPPAPASDPLATILDAATDGTLSAKKLAELIDASAQSRAAETFRGDLARRAAGELVRRFGVELLNGAADEILDSLRPAFEQAAATIDEALQLVDLSQPYEEFVNSADPDQLAAYQRLRPAAATIDQIVSLATRFGPRSLSWPLIVSPVEGGIYDAFVPVEDRALFVVPPGGSIGSWSNMWRSYNPGGMGMRTSPWMTGGLRLNSVSEAREHVRVFA